MLSKAQHVTDDAEGIVYWMTREERIQGMVTISCPKKKRLTFYGLL